MVSATTGLDLLRAEPPQFDSEAYLQHFAPYRWAYLVGFPEIVHTATLATPHPSRDAVRRQVRIISQAPEYLLPQSWRFDFPDAEWDSCDRTQASFAYYNKLMRFDKGCILAKSLEAVFAGGMGEKSLPLIDVCQHLQFRPATYVLTGLEEWEWLVEYPKRIQDPERKILCQLKRNLKPIAKPNRADKFAREGSSERFNWNDTPGQFIARAIAGDGVTWRNAILLYEAFKSMNAPVEIQILPQRVFRGRLRKANPHESHFVGLSLQQQDELRGAFRLLKLA